MTAVYCEQCGAELQNQSVGGRTRQVCTRCGKVRYEQLLVGVGALVERNGRLLLLRRANEPFKGKWGVPGGHVEADEDPEQAAIREIVEETSLQAEFDGVAGIYFHSDHPRGPGLFISYWVRVSAGTATRSTEADEVGYFARDRMPVEIAGGGHSLAVAAWRTNQLFPRRSSDGLERDELWTQLSNAINLRSSQDQVLWAIFGAFWAANALLLVALFTTGDLPANPVVGIVTSAVGAALSAVWHQVQKRALVHIERHERLMTKMSVAFRNSHKAGVLKVLV